MMERFVCFHGSICSLSNYPSVKINATIKLLTSNTGRDKIKENLEKAKKEEKKGI